MLALINRLRESGKKMNLEGISASDTTAKKKPDYSKLRKEMQDKIASDIAKKEEKKGLVK